MGTIDRRQFFEYPSLQRSLIDLASNRLAEKSIQTPIGKARDIVINPKFMRQIVHNQYPEGVLLRTVFEQFTRMRRIRFRYNESIPDNQVAAMDPRNAFRAHIIQAIMPHIAGQQYTLVDVSLILKEGGENYIAKYHAQKASKFQKIAEPLRKASTEELYAFSFILHKLGLLE